jgi:hypothetical protein
MSTSIETVNVMTGAGYVSSGAGTANGNRANGNRAGGNRAGAADMVTSAQAMLVSAAFKMDSALAALSAAFAELAAILPPQAGPDGKVDPAAQQAYEAKRRAAEAKVGRANQDVLKANYDYRNAVEALDRANMMLPVAQEREDAQRRALEESSRLVQERQRRIDDAMRHALEAAHDVSDRFSDPALISKPLGEAPTSTGLASNDGTKPSVDAKGIAAETLLRTGRMNAASARAQEWKSLARAANAEAIVGLLRVNLVAATPTDQSTWQSAIDDMEGRRVSGTAPA